MLPILSDAWRDGSFEGLMARGGFCVSAEWKDGRVTHCTVKGADGKPLRLKYHDTVIDGVGEYHF